MALFCFVSTRRLRADACDHLLRQLDGPRTQPTSRLQTQAAPLIPGRLVFDVELDASGGRLCYTCRRACSPAARSPPPPTLRLARLVDDRFRLDPSADALVRIKVNTAGARIRRRTISADGLDAVLHASRQASLSLRRRYGSHGGPRTDAAFDAPQRICRRSTDLSRPRTFRAGWRDLFSSPR